MQGVANWAIEQMEDWKAAGKPMPDIEPQDAPTLQNLGMLTARRPESPKHTVQKEVPADPCPKCGAGGRAEYRDAKVCICGHIERAPAKDMHSTNTISNYKAY